MMKFEVGKEYEPYQREYGSVKVIRRTDRTIWVEKHESWGDHRWFMRIKRDADGNEYAVDSKVPYKWRDAFTYMAEYVAE